VDFAKIFQKNIVITSKLNFFDILAFFPSGLVVLDFYLFI